MEANLFAAELLMPSAKIEDQFCADKSLNRGCDETTIEELAERFNVSEIAMTVRLSSLGYIRM